MVVAWYFATALAKQEKSTLFYFENAILPVWVHNKAIQKAVESRRISPELKEYVKGLKIKQAKDNFFVDIAKQKIYNKVWSMCDGSNI